jgi:hypothetical protein
MNFCCQKVYLLFWLFSVVYCSLVASFVIETRPHIVVRYQSIESLSMTSFRKGDALTSSAPLYITIGPQCCGKTTFLKTLNAQDISLDDQPDVYVPVPTQLWLAPNASTSNTTQVPPQLLQQIQGKSIEYRMKHDNAELNLILQRWDQQLSPQNFAVAMLQHYSTLRPNSNSNVDTIKVAHMLIQVVEEFLSAPQKLPEHTQVFCLESLFRPHAQTNQSAIQMAHTMLRNTPSHIPVAWGNTNSKAKDYQQALEIACQTGRPIFFVLSHPSCQLLDKSLPWVDFKVLLKRNLQRLCDAGKYIPANAIHDCCHRIEQLQLIPPHCKTPWDVEQALVEMATQQPRHHRKPPRYRYRLTSQRLIQKQYPQQQQQQQHRHQKRQYHQQNNDYSEKQRGSHPNNSNNNNDNNRRRFDDSGYYDRRPYGNDFHNDGREERRRPSPPQQGNKRRYYDDDDQRQGKDHSKRPR